MGQYFLILNLDKKEYIKPKDGLKLWEICQSDAPALLVYLLRESEDGSSAGSIGRNAGRWARDRIVVVGDYAYSNLYNIAQETYKEISNEVYDEFETFMNS